MANDVTIVVEASLGDTLLKLELAKVAVNDLETPAALGFPSATTRTATVLQSPRNLRNELGNMGDRGPLGSIIRGFGNLAGAMLAPIQLGADMANNFEERRQVGQVRLIGSRVAGRVLRAFSPSVILSAVQSSRVLASTLGTL
jgi:hypothetical protein